MNSSVTDEQHDFLPSFAKADAIHQREEKEKLVNPLHAPAADGIAVQIARR
jgi:hypothetical protein